MAKHKIAAGEEIDVLNADEARQIVDDVVARVVRQADEIEWRGEESAVTDANGNALIPVFVVPPGRIFRITRLVAAADGFTAAAPFRNPAGALQVLRGNTIVDFVNLENGLPALSTDSRDTGTRWRNGELVQVQLIGGPANTSVNVTAQGFLRHPDDAPTPRGRTRFAAEEDAGQMVAP